MICITQDKYCDNRMEIGMEATIPVIIYGLEVIKYWIGNKLFFGGRVCRPWLAAAVGAGLFIGINVFEITDVGANILAYSVSVVAAAMTIKGSLKRKVFALIWLYGVVSSLDATIIAMYKRIFDYEGAAYIFGSFCTMLGIGIIGYLFSRLLKKLDNKKIMFTVLYIVLILVCLGVNFTISAVQFIYESLPEGMEWINLDWLMIISFAALTLLIILVFYIQKLYGLLEKAVATERSLKQIQSVYYQSLLETEEETRKYRHDMHNHLLAIRELARSEKAVQTAEYTESLEEKWKQVGSGHYETGNRILNLLLHYHLSALQDAEVSIRGFCTREVRIDEVDFCTIFSNLIQNAAEELEKQHQDKYFILEINQGRENTRITIRNSSSIGVLTRNNQKLLSSKRDKGNHGIGMENAKDTVEKYGGEIFWNSDGKEFKVVVTMKI
ncbi:MAG: GHKL domain-containing protein [Lachnospiraceae bacterium]